MSRMSELDLDLQLLAVRTAMTDEPTGAPVTPAELNRHNIASRLASITGELDDLIALSRDFDAPALQAAIQAEDRALSAILARAQLLCSFIDSRKPAPLRVVGRR